MSQSCVEGMNTYNLSQHFRMDGDVATENGIDNPDFFLNGDQTGFALVPTGKRTWSEKGAKQVEGLGHDEKRQVSSHFSA